MKKEKNDDNLNSITFARLPIFDNERNLWGYELIYVPVGASKTKDSEQSNVITADLMAGTSLALDHGIGKKNKIMVNFSVKNILDKIPYALPPGRTAVKITDPVAISDALVQTLGKLKEDGYQIAINWNKDHQTFGPVFEMADIICLNIHKMNAPELTGICQKTASCDSIMMASRVDDLNRFNVCQKAGFSFFQGAFFKQPEDVSVKKMLPGTISRFKLMEAIEQSDPDFSKLAATIQADVAISFRLLAHLNSASFGFRQQIDSIKDAITILGWNNLRNWLRVILLAEVSENQQASELIFLSAQRGKFLEQISIDHDYWGFDPDSLFLLGMFSLLDALLCQPMTDILKYLPLADKLKGALCMEDNNEYVPLLRLAKYFEEAKFNQSDAMINQLGLDTIKVKQAYIRSIEFANKLSDM